MNILTFLKDYWTQIVFFVGIIGILYKFIKSMIEAVKCLLRNDILQIYNDCKDTKKITRYQLQAIDLSYSLYHKLKGNSFVDDIYKIVHEFELID